jgi:hypothetical protein
MDSAALDVHQFESLMWEDARGLKAAPPVDRHREQQRGADIRSSFDHARRTDPDNAFFQSGLVCCFRSRKPD